MKDVPRTNLLSSVLLLTTLVLPPAAFGAWMLTLAGWIWSGHRRLRLALLVTHAFLLLLGMLAVHAGFRAIEAAERSTAAGGGLLSPLAFLPFCFAVPVFAFALFSIAMTLWVIPPRPSDFR
jgi:hypothetical protein